MRRLLDVVELAPGLTVREVARRGNYKQVRYCQDFIDTEIYGLWFAVAG